MRDTSLRIGSTQLPPNPYAVLATGLSHYWTFEEASGSRVDSVGSTSWAVNTGSPGRNTGKSNFGASVAVGSQLAVATSSLLPSGSWTLAFWVKPTGYTTFFGNDTPILVSTIGTTGFDFVRVGTSGTSVKIIAYPSGASATLSSVFSLNNFHHVVIWWDGTSLRLQVDGGTIATATGSFARTSGSMLMSYTDTLGMAGIFDEMALWSRVLSVSERALHYNAGAGKFYPY
jgi:hypothetical protein